MNGALSTVWFVVIVVIPFCSRSLYTSLHAFVFWPTAIVHVTGRFGRRIGGAEGFFVPKRREIITDTQAMQCSYFLTVTANLVFVII